METSIVRRSFSAFRDKIESPALVAIADHWDEARANGRMPAWSDLRPSSLAPYLTRIWSYKYDRATGEFTARLAGNQVTLSFGISFRGTPLRDIHPPQVVELVQERMTRIVQGPFLYRNYGNLFRRGDQITRGERIVLPLASDREICDGALGAAEFPAAPPMHPKKPVELMYELEHWFSLSDEQGH